MTVAGLLAILAGHAVGASAKPFERITAPVAASRVARCGLGPVSISFDDVWRSAILTAKSAHASSDEPLACADRAASFYQLELPPDLQPRFDSIRSDRLSAQFRAEARAWLSERGLLGRLPRYQPGVTDDAEFTRAVESLCGRRARGAFRSEYGFHAVSPDWAMRVLSPPGQKGSDTLACILNATRVAGYELGLIGNETFADEE